MYAFVLPDATIGTMTEKVILKQGADATGFETSGTLVEWRREVAAPCINNSRLLLAISTAFAAPLLGILGKEGGGFHFVGESSLGKTTLSYVGASVVGSPDNTIKPMNATANSFEGEAANCNDSVMFLDELGEAPPEQIGGIVYKLAGGKGRGRADQHGNAKARNTWRILFITTGETDLESMMKTANRRTFAGQALRLALEVRPAPQAPTQPTVRLPAVAHQDADIVPQEVSDQFLAAMADVIQDGAACDEHPQPQRRRTLFRPGGLVGM